MQRFFILALSAAYLSVFPARAADDGTNQRFQAYLGSAKFKNQMLEAALLSDAYVELGCVDKGMEVRLKNIAGVANLKMPAGADFPISGVWRISYSAKRCGKQVIHNTWFQARRKGRPRIVVATPGASIASLQLQKDMMLTVYAAAANAAKLKDCKRFKPVDAKLVKAPAKSKDDKGIGYTLWAERWTLLMCNRLIEVPIQFIQRTNVPGTSFAVQNLKELTVSVREESKSVSMNDFRRAISRVTQGSNIAADMKLISHMARTGFNEAQYVLAVIYLNGTKSIEWAPLKSFYWAAHAAQANHAKAMDLLGRMYVAGAVVQKDHNAALDWFNKSYKAGYLKAQEMIDALTAQGFVDSKSATEIILKALSSAPQPSPPHARAVPGSHPRPSALPARRPSYRPAR